MPGSALQQAHALSVNTRKYLRSVPIEDPLQAVERIQEYVRTHTYAESYTYLRSPPDIEAPHHQKSESGAGYFLGAVLLAPIWVLAAPLLLTGFAKSLSPPNPDERLNQPLMLELLENLATLKKRLEGELVADVTNARKVKAQLDTYGIQGIASIRTHTVTKDWDSIYATRAGSVKKRRNGWHLSEMGQLHIGATNACFYGDDGQVIELDLRRVASTTIAKRCIILLNPTKSRGRKVAFFVPTRVFETGAQLNALRSRVVAEQNAEQRTPITRSAAGKLATKGIDAVKRLRPWNRS